MKKIFLVAAAIMCSIALSAQTMQVKSGGDIVFEGNVEGIEEVALVPDNGDPYVAFKKSVIQLNYNEQVDLADLMFFYETQISNVTFTSSNPSAVAVVGHTIVAKNVGKSVISAELEGMPKPALLQVRVQYDGVMYIDDIFTVTGRGTVATGEILFGKFNVGQPAVVGSCVDETGELNTAITGIEMFHKSIDQAEAGESVGLLLRGIDKSQLNRGDIIYVSGNTRMFHKKTIKGTLYVLTKEEGGRHTPFMINYRPQARVETTDFTVTVTDLGTVNGEAVELMFPGSTAENLVIQFADDVTPYTYIGQQIFLREGARTVARFTVTGYGE